jgi:predicted kinase
MDQRIYITKGLPASGKSSWAKQFQATNPNVTRVNRDDLRAMLHLGLWTKENEKLVVKYQRAMIEDAIKAGHTVIIDDTNLAPSTMTMWKQLAETLKVPWEVKDFTDVHWLTCVARNECRANPVPVEAMKRMRKLLQAEKEGDRHKYLPYNPELPDAVMCDLDGTIAIFNGRNPYDGSKCDTDLVNEPVRWVLAMIQHLGNAKLIFMSARDDEWYDKTWQWLIEKAGVTPHALFMRKTGDKRDDGLVKRELFAAHIEGKYNVKLVLDDRDRVVATWRSLSLPCFAVADGDF